MSAFVTFFKAAVLLFLVCISSVCLAQKILVFDRDWHTQRIRFHIHDEIAVHAGDSWSEGEITDIADSTITVAYEVIAVSAIDAIRYDSRSSFRHLLGEMSSKFPAAGVSLLAIYAINAVINNSYPIYSTNELVLAGALIVAGPLAYRLSYNKYKINKHHRLKVIDVSIR